MTFLTAPSQRVVHDSADRSPGVEASFMRCGDQMRSFSCAQRRKTRKLKSMIRFLKIAFVVWVILTCALFAFAAFLHTFNEYLKTQNSIYTPKDEERLRYQQEQRDKERKLREKYERYR